MLKWEKSAHPKRRKIERKNFSFRNEKFFSTRSLLCLLSLLLFVSENRLRFLFFLSSSSTSSSLQTWFYELQFWYCVQEKIKRKKNIFGCKDKRNHAAGRGVTELASDSCGWRRKTVPERSVELQQSTMVPPRWSTTLAGARSDQAEPSCRRNAFNSLYLGHCRAWDVAWTGKSDNQELVLVFGNYSWLINYIYIIHII